MLTFGDLPILLCEVGEGCEVVVGLSGGWGVVCKTQEPLPSFTQGSMHPHIPLCDVP